jgi:hypothetical protein
MQELQRGLHERAPSGRGGLSTTQGLREGRLGDHGPKTAEAIEAAEVAVGKGTGLQGGQGLRSRRAKSAVQLPAVWSVLEPGSEQQERPGPEQKVSAAEMSCLPVGADGAAGGVREGAV